MGDPRRTGYLLKDRVSEPRAFVAAVGEVGRGGSVVDPEVLAALRGHPAGAAVLDALTPRGREAMRRLSRA
jgi:hypothetical protein